VWEETSASGSTLGHKAILLWEEWSAVQQLQQGTSRTEQQQQSFRWEKPLHGWYKCNVDAALHQSMNKISIG
jgi:hypothetical protein